MNVLEVENLSVALDGKEILRNVSFVLKEGEGLAIIGPAAAEGVRGGSASHWNSQEI